MTNDEINSWIFLAVAVASQREPASVSSISTIADGIMHAVPTQGELKSAFKWLIDEDFVIKSSTKYQLTEKGLTLYKTTHTDSNFVLDHWHKLRDNFTNLRLEK